MTPSTENVFRNTQSSIARAKEDLLKGEGLAFSPFVQANVNLMWSDAFARKVDPHGDRLPASVSNTSLLPSGSVEALMLMKRRTTKSFQAEVETLRRDRIAVFPILYFDNQPIIFDALGNEGLLVALEDRGVTIGSVFMEEILGENIVTSAFATHTPQWLVGEENYFDCLSDFAFYVDPNYGGDLAFFHGDFALMYVVLSDDYSYLKDYVERSASIRTQNSSLTNIPQIMVKNRGFDNLLFRRGIALIIADSTGTITDLNKYCEALFNRSYICMLGQSVNTLFPEICFNDIAADYGQTFFYRTGYSSAAASELSFEIERISNNKGVMGYCIYISDAARLKKRKQSSQKPRSAISFSQLIGGNPRFRRLKAEAEQAAALDSGVLIVGESGTGKETLAHCIHNASRRSSGPLVIVDCNCYISDSIDVALFGNTSISAISGNREDYIGKIERANGGTLFLSNIDQLPLHSQTTLASVLRNGAVVRIGSTLEQPVDIRVIASSCVDLAEAVEEGRFRRDLFMAISVIRLQTVPLRDRGDDISSLVRGFIPQLNRMTEKKIDVVTPEAMDYLSAYPWPGNIRELKNVLERAMAFAESNKLTCSCLPPELKVSIENTNPATSGYARPKSPTPVSFRESEAQRIKRLMSDYNGNKTKVAEELGVSRNTLYRRLKEISDWS